MNFVKILSVIVLLVAPFVTFSQELRAGVELEKDIWNNIETDLMLQGRAGEDDMVLYKSMVSELGMYYTRFKYFQLGTTARYKYTDKDKMSINDVDGNKRITADVNIKIPENIKDTKLKYRFRYQLAGDNNKGYSEYLRNRIKMQRKVSEAFGSSASYEIFYNLEKNRMDAHRIKLSLNYKVSKRIGLDNFFIIDQSFIAPSIDPNAKRLKYKYSLGIMAIFDM